MKKSAWIIIVAVAVVVIAAGIYIVSTGFFTAKPQIAENAVASDPLPQYLAEAGLLTYEHFNDVELTKVPDRYKFTGDGSATVEAVPADTNYSLKLQSADSEATFTLHESFPEQTGEFTIKLKVMQPEAGLADVLQLTSEEESVFSLQLTEDGTLISPELSEPIVSGYEAGDWLAVKVVANVSADSADVYVNGLPEATKIAFSESVDLIDGWEAAVHDDQSFYVDDIIISPGQLDLPPGFATVGMLPVGGMGGETVTVSTAEELREAVQGTDPRTIYISGELDFSEMLEIDSNKTIIGADDEAGIIHGGLRMKNVSNVVIRNLTFTYATDDAIEIRDGSTNIWVDHNTFTEAYDGAVDIRLASDFVTVSWNYFYNQGKTSLVGSSDNDTGDAGHLHVTYAFNRFENSTSRHPMIRFGEGHILNNLYQGIRNYAVRAYTHGSVLVEGNAYYDTKTPMEIVDGQLEQRDNLFVNSGDPVTEGSVFDPFSYYTYTVEPAEQLLDLIEAHAGAGKHHFN